MPRRVAALLTVLAAAAVAVAGVAVGQQGQGQPPTAARPGENPSQTLFRGLLLADAKTSPTVRGLLRDGGFVNPNIRFADLTGDGKLDAVVRVGSGGTAGDVALYVFSADREPNGRLRPVYRAQSLFRAAVVLKGPRLFYRVPRYQPGDQLCCPPRLLERALAWSARTRHFRVTATREISLTQAQTPAPPPPSG